MKLGLDKAVLKSFESNGEKEAISKNELESLLKYGAYHIFKEEKDGNTEKESREFLEADIDQILEKNSHILTIEDNETGGQFSKASFVSNTCDQIDINDPNFWYKYIDMGDEMEHTEVPKKRERREMISSRKAETLVDTDGSWNKSERDRLITSLLSEGFGKWEDIIEKSNLVTKHSKDEVIDMITGMIMQWCRIVMIIEDCDDKDEIKEKMINGSGHKSRAYRVNNIL